MYMTMSIGHVVVDVD